MSGSRTTSGRARSSQRSPGIANVIAGASKKARLTRPTATLPTTPRSSSPRTVKTERRATVWSATSRAGHAATSPRRERTGRRETRGRGRRGRRAAGKPPGGRGPGCRARSMSRAQKGGGWQGPSRWPVHRGPSCGTRSPRAAGREPASPLRPQRSRPRTRARVPARGPREARTPRRGPRAIAGATAQGCASPSRSSAPTATGAIAIQRVQRMKSSVAKATIASGQSS